MTLFDFYANFLSAAHSFIFVPQRTLGHIFSGGYVDVELNSQVRALMQRNRTSAYQLLEALKIKVSALDKKIKTAEQRIKEAGPKEAAVVKITLAGLKKRKEMLLHIGSGLSDLTALSLGIMFSLLQNLAYVDGDEETVKPLPMYRIFVPGAYSRFRPVV